MSASPKANADADAGFKHFADVHDLNIEAQICDAFGFDQPGVAHECGQDAVRAGDGVRAVEDLRPHHRATPGRRWRAHAGLRDLFRIMAFAQLTWRESLRDIEACLSANQAKLFHLGIQSCARALDLGRCSQSSRLARLPCAGSATDHALGRCMPKHRRCSISRPASMHWTPPLSICA